MPPPDPGRFSFLKFGTRYYMPQLGTWTQADPKSGKMQNPPTLNSFAYSWGNPVNVTDPSGRFGIFDAIGTAAMLYSAYEAWADGEVTTEEFVTFAIAEGSGLAVELGCNVLAGYTTVGSSLAWAGPICGAAGIAVGSIVGGAIE